MYRGILIALLLYPAIRLGAAVADPGAVWTRKVQPLIDVYCVKCHGPLEKKSGLELDRPDAVLKGGDEGPVVVPGDPAKSRIYLYLSRESDPHMPPKKQLSEVERESFREWIAAMAAVPAKTTAPTPTHRSFASIPEAIDTLVAEGWKRRDLTPAHEIDERTWCRRVYLDLAGRVPTSPELEGFLKSKSATKRESLVDQLLASEEYAVRMRELWDVFLMGRPKRDNHEDRRIQNGWWSFLETAFRTDRPWNETVHDLLAARSDRPENKGASWFLYERRNDHQLIAEAVAPVVYGARIDCAQCHDHPLAREIKQAHYWGLVAAFNRSKNVDGGAEISESAVGGFINFTNLKKESQPAVMLLLNGRSVDEKRPAEGQKETDADENYVKPAAGVRVPKFSRREALAEAATHENPLLARAFVNRMWAALLGRGIVHPADEMTARNAPSHPELLDWLAHDFADHGHTPRRLVRGIVLSRVYALDRSSAPPEAFAGFLERPLTAEQLARSWQVAMGLSHTNDVLRRAVVAAIPEVLPKDYNATFQQAQFLANSTALAELLKPAPGGALDRMTGLPTTPARVQDAFLTVYGRVPDAEEATQAGQFLNQRPDAPALAAGDLFWALMTSAEYLTMP